MTPLALSAYQRRHAQWHSGEGIWINLLLHRCVNIQGRTTGFLFCKPGRPNEKAA